MTARLECVIVALCAGVLLLAGRCSAGVVNCGDFDAGSLAGWTTSGDTSVQTAYSGITPTSLNYEALLTSGCGSNPSSPTVSGTPSVLPGLVETQLRLTSGRLSGLIPAPVAQASAISQTIGGHAGDRLSFAWNFATTETVASDFAFWSLVEVVDVNGQATYNEHVLQILENTDFSHFARKDTPAKINNESPRFEWMTDWQTTSYDLPTDGEYLLGFGVVDVHDYYNYSGLFLDDVDLGPTSVPEPSTVVLSAIGTFSLACAAMRKRWATSRQARSYSSA